MRNCHVGRNQYVAIVLSSLADFRKIITRPGVEGIYMHGARTRFLTPH
jgi:hypothetical protein